MTKQRRRKEAKAIYPLATAGNIEAVGTLQRIMKYNPPITTCNEPGCGRPTRGSTCRMHMPSRRSMRRALLSFVFLALFSIASVSYAQNTNIVGCITLAWNDPNSLGMVENYYLYHSTNALLPLTNWTRIVSITGGTTNVPVFVTSGYHGFYVTCSNGWFGETGPSNVYSTNTPVDLIPAVSFRIVSMYHTNGQ